MPKYISGRIKLRDPGKLTADRYRYLGLDQAEPNLGDPPDGTPPTGAIPSGERYQIVSIEGHPGERYWIPVEGGIIPGTFTIYDEGTLVGGINSTSQLNFVGAAISASSINTFKETTLTLADSLTFSFTQGLGVTQKNSDAFGYVKESTTNSGIVTITNVTGSFTTNAADELFQDAVGIARTPLSKSAVINASVASSITVSPEFFSTNEQVIFNDNGEFNGAGGLVYRKNGASDDTSVGLASVGIGTTNPYRTLHVDGDIKLTGSIEDYNNSRGDLGDLLVKNNFGGIEWTDQRSVIVGAAGTFYEVQFHGATGYLNGADKLVYRSDLNGGQIGIGSTIPTALLDVLGNSKHTGVSTFNNILSVAAGSTFIIGNNPTQVEHEVIGDDLIIKTQAPKLSLVSAGNSTSEIKLLENLDNTKYGAFIRYDGGSPDPNNYLIIGGYNNNTEYMFFEAHRANTTSYALRFYNDNNIKFEVKNTGAKVTGNIEVTSGTSDFQGDVKFDGQTADRDIYFDRSEDSLYAYDNAQFRVGNGGDVRIYHDTSNTYIEPKSDGVGDLIVGSATTDIAKFVYNGGVSLYYQDVLKFDTIGAGVTVYGTAILPQINTVGIATIDHVQIGHSDDNTINTSTGNLILDSADGTVQVNDVLYLNDSTQSTNAATGALRVNGGAGITKNLNVGGAVTCQNLDVSGIGTFNTLVLKDDKLAKFGDSNDLLIYHAVSTTADHANESYITAQNNGLNIEANSGGHVRIKGSYGNGTLAKFNSGGKTELYYNGNKKLETTTSGIDVTGHTETDTLNVSGIATILTLGVTGLTTTKDLEVTGIATIATLGITGLTTTKDLEVTGITTANDKEIYTKFDIENSGFGAYSFKSTGIGFTQNQDNPDIYLNRGQNYRFDVDASGHPFWIKTVNSTGIGNSYNDGVIGNGIAVGIVTFKVPFNSPNILYYNCQSHSAMYGRIYINDNNDGSSVIGTFTASSGNTVDIDTFDYTRRDYKSSEYTLHFEDSAGNIQASKCLIMQNNTTSFIQEYAIMFDPNRIVNLTTTISGNNVKLRATAQSGITGIVTYRYNRGTML